MRNPFAAAKVRTFLAAPQWAASRPDVLRGQALFFTTMIMLVAAAIAYPVALYFLVHGAAMPVVAASAALACAAVALVFHQKKNLEGQVLCHVLAIASMSAVLTLTDPQLFDFGLALGLLAALYAMLTSRSRYRHWAWAVPTFALTCSVLHSAGVIRNPLAQAGSDRLFVAVAVYAAAVMIIAVVANRFNFAAVAAARNQMKTFDLLIESFRDAVVRYDAEGAIMQLSRSASKLLGCNAFELDDNGLFERIHVMDRPAYMAALSDARTRGIHTALDVRMRRDSDKPGTGAEYIWVEVSLSPIVDDADANQTYEVLGILRDISKRKNAESKIDTARRVAEEASEAKSRFLATIGHELRTPLNAIVGFSDMMQANIGGQLTPTHKEYAELISQSGHHLLDVVNMLLDMSKIEAGKFEVHTELFDPASMVEPCSQIVDKAARDRNISIKAVVPDNLPQIVGDERACRQILINLLSNATKFSHDGGTVELSMKRQGKMLNISVRDRGIGMGAETIDRIGEPFLEAQNGLSRRYEGTGLGLSIVKGLVALHDGQFHVFSEVGQGTTISILLPIDGPDGRRPAASIEHLHPPQASDDETQWLEDERKSAAK